MNECEVKPEGKETTMSWVVALLLVILGALIG